MVSATYKGWRIAEDLKSNYGIAEFFEKPIRANDVADAAQRLLVGEKAEGRVEAVERISREAEGALTAGVDAYKRGLLDEAITQLERGVRLDPLAYRLRFHLGLLYGKRGQIFEGIAELERAVDLNPKYFAGLKNLAVLYEKAGFRNRAAEMWERCIHVAPDAAAKQQIRQHLLALLE